MMQKVKLILVSVLALPLISTMLILAFVFDYGHADTIKVKDLVYIYDLAKSSAKAEMYVITDSRRLAKPAKAIRPIITLWTTEEIKSPNLQEAATTTGLSAEPINKEAFIKLPAKETPLTEKKPLPPKTEANAQTCIKCRLNIFFPCNGYALSAAERDQIDQHLSYLKKFKVRVTGFTCALGKKGYNKILARKRAGSVAEYLVKNGVKVTETAGKGGEGYISGVHKNNRRVEIAVLPPEESRK